MLELFSFRDKIIVSIPLNKENFQRLPANLQNGDNVSIYPVLFNVGINEHAFIAERYLHFCLSLFL